MQILKSSIILLIILVSCSNDYELNRSIFIADTEYPSLPVYTEWGYNTFGVLYDRAPLVNTDFTVPAKVINTGGITTFSLNGHIGGSRYSYYPQEDNPIKISFDLYGFEPSCLADLMELNDIIIDLTDPLCKVNFMVESLNYDVTVLNGTLHFKRAQNLIVDKQAFEIILSGVFEFQALINDEPSSFSSGRFDVGIASDNFFIY